MSAQVVGKRLPLGSAGTVTQGSDTLVTNRISNDIIPFGSAVALNGDNTVAAFGATNIASNFVGFAVRIVKQQQAVFETVGAYSNGELADVLTRGVIAVNFKGQGTPQAGSPVFLRIAENELLPNAMIGDVEAQADVVGEDTNTIQITNAVFRTGIVTDGVVEVTVTERRV